MSTLKTRILNACTTEPRTAQQMQELLQVPLSTLKNTITNLLRDGTLHYAGMFKPDKGRKLQMYTNIKPMSVPHLTVWRRPLPTRTALYTGPILTVWRGPLPTEWRM